MHQIGHDGCTATYAMLAFQGRLLKRAVEICGGGNALCARIGVNEHSVKLWLDGKAGMPERVFLKVADIVLEDDIARAEQDRRGAPRVAVLAASAESQTRPSSTP
jgi:hypothetical protein